jgi:hypothetical protein
MDVLDYTIAQWQRLKHIWYDTQREWKGINADYFANAFWAEFADDMRDYLNGLEELQNEMQRLREVLGD